MAHPAVSVIIPVYNADKYLQACLDSAIAQTLTDIEIICVDDSSSDCSYNILSSYADSDARISIVKHDTKRGAGAARNTGLAAAHGEYVFYLDADDTIPHKALEVLSIEADAHGSDMVKGAYALIDENGRIEHPSARVPKHKIINTNIYDSKFLQRIPVGHWSYLYRRQFINLQKLKYRTDLITGEDLVVLAESLIHANSVTLIPDIVYCYHQRKNSVTRGEVSLTKALDAIRSRMIIVDVLNAHGLCNAAMSRLQNWSYDIRTYWLRMSFTLTGAECRKVFSAFRNLAAKNRVIPWTSSTPHNYRYVLCLILANRDQEAICFLRSKQPRDGFSSQHRLVESLDFVLQQVPGDIGSLIALAQMARSEGRVGDALRLYEELLQYHPDHLDAQLETSTMLGEVGKYQKAYHRLDIAFESVIKGMRNYSQIKKVAATKDDIAQKEKTCLTEELKAARKELESVRSALNAVYASTSWRITRPLRVVMRRIKGRA